MIIATATLTVFAQSGFEFGLPEIARTTGLYNPAQLSANQAEHGLLGFSYERIPYVASSPTQNFTNGNILSMEGAIRIGDIAVSASLAKSKKNYQETFQNMGTISMAAGTRINAQWSLGASYGYESLQELVGSQAEVTSEDPIFSYERFGVYLQMNYSDVLWNFRITPIQSSSQAPGNGSIDTVKQSWTGPIGVESSVSSKGLVGSSTFTKGVRVALDVPTDSIDHLHFEVNPFLRMSLGTLSSVQGSVSIGSMNSAMYWLAGFGLDLGVVRGLFVSLGATLEHEHFPLDKQASTMGSLVLGLGWNFL